MRGLAVRLFGVVGVAAFSVLMFSSNNLSFF